MSIKEKIQAAINGNVSEAKSLCIIMDGTKAYDDPNYRKLSESPIKSKTDACIFGKYVEKIYPILMEEAMKEQGI